MSDAHCAFIFTPPSRTNSVMIGSAAKIDDSPRESPTGSYTCWYMRLSSLCGPSGLLSTRHGETVNASSGLALARSRVGGGCDAVKREYCGRGHGCPRCIFLAVCEVGAAEFAAARCA